MGIDHLEAPERIKIIDDALRSSDLPIEFIKAAVARPKEIIHTHKKELFDRVKHSQQKGRMTFTPDTIANKHTFQAALTAAGGSIQTAINLYKNHSFAMLRPPGHHATTNTAMGFCFFNNIAIATTHLLRNKSKRVAIIDIDNHHGNGTQDIFYTNPDVLYLSLHAGPTITFPGTGYLDEVGEAEGIGKTVNVPLPYHTTDDDYLYAFDTIFSPIIHQYRPDTILVSLGLDALESDPYGSLSLSLDVYHQLGMRIARLQKQLTKRKVGVFLEGGYKYEELGQATVNFFEALLYPEKYDRYILNPTRKMQKIIYHVRSFQRNYWYGI